MENVTDEVSNPFGMRPPCPTPCSDDNAAVFGYGDANADFHVVGDHPGVHGGRETGIPFTGTPGGERLWTALAAAGLVDERPEPPGETSEPPIPRRCFLSYLHPCCLPPGESPTPTDYARLEPFFDAELRAITADVLVPVGDRALEHVLAEFTGREHRVTADAARHHGREIPGRGFLVVPVDDPDDWTDADERDFVDRIRDLIDSGYEQLADLGRFSPGADSYFVR